MQNEQFVVFDRKFYLLIRSGINLRFNDPSMTQAQVIWTIFVVLLTLFFMNRFRFLMVPFLPLALMFGAFNMTSRQYAGMAVLIVVGYCAAIGLVAFVPRNPSNRSRRFRVAPYSC